MGAFKYAAPPRGRVPETAAHYRGSGRCPDNRRPHAWKRFEPPGQQKGGHKTPLAGTIVVEKAIGSTFASLNKATSGSSLTQAATFMYYATLLKAVRSLLPGELMQNGCIIDLLF